MTGKIASMLGATCVGILIGAAALLWSPMAEAQGMFSQAPQVQPARPAKIARSLPGSRNGFLTKAKTVVPGAGPRGVDMNTALAVVVKAPVDFKCGFKGRGNQAFVIYHLVSGQWKPMQSCNNGAGPERLGSLIADERDPRRLITGWYELGKGWQQCDFRGWKSDGSAPYLSCGSADGWSFTFTCIKGQCANP